MEKGKISVIIPVYNVEKYLPKCLDSVINQTYKNLEIILVDDGSPDNSGIICDEYAKKDTRVRVIHKKNGGLADARNRGMDTATGQYIAFADSDDYIEPDMYECMRNEIIKYNADMAICGVIYEYEDGKRETADIQTDKYLMGKDDFLKNLVSMQYGFGYAWNKLYSADKLLKHRFRTEDGCSEDICFNYRYVIENSKFVCVNGSKYHYVQREGAITKGKFCDNAFSIVKATKMFMMNQKNNSNVYPYCVKGYTDAAYTVLSGVITSGVCSERFEELRQGILAHRKEIFFGGHHKLKDKVKCVILNISPTLYKTVIKKIRSM